MQRFKEVYTRFLDLAYGYEVVGDETNAARFREKAGRLVGAVNPEHQKFDREHYREGPFWRRVHAKKLALCAVSRGQLAHAKKVWNASGTYQARFDFRNERVKAIRIRQHQFWVRLP